MSIANKNCVNVPPTDTPDIAPNRQPPRMDCRTTQVSWRGERTPRPNCQVDSHWDCPTDMQIMELLGDGGGRLQPFVGPLQLHSACLWSPPTMQRLRLKIRDRATRENVNPPCLVLFLTVPEAELPLALVKSDPSHVRLEQGIRLTREYMQSPCLQLCILKQLFTTNLNHPHPPPASPENLL